MSDEQLSPCKVCLRRVPTAFVSFTELTGMLVARRERQFFGLLCHGCLGPTYRRYTIHTLVLGWWGIISIFLTPIYAISNTVDFLKGRRALARSAVVMPVGQIRPS